MKKARCSATKSVAGQAGRGVLGKYWFTSVKYRQEEHPRPDTVAATAVVASAGTAWPPERMRGWASKSSWKSGKQAAENALHTNGKKKAVGAKKGRKKKGDSKKKKKKKK